MVGGWIPTPARWNPPSACRCQTVATASVRGSRGKRILASDLMSDYRPIATARQTCSAFEPVDPMGTTATFRKTGFDGWSAPKRIDAAHPRTWQLECTVVERMQTPHAIMGWSDRLGSELVR
jgi:hypothetical protein